MSASEGLTCPFCRALDQGQGLHENQHAVSLKDGFPISEGHTLVVPRTHQSDFLSLDSVIQKAILDLGVQIANELRTDPDVTGVNMGCVYGTKDGAGEGEYKRA